MKNWRKVNQWENSLIGVALISCLVLSGCAELEKKLIRKSKPKPVRPLINIEPERRPHAELYREHFRYWKVWHEEILRDLRGNPKRLQRDLKESRRHLSSLERYLVPEKGEVIRSFVAEFDGIKGELESDPLSPSRPNPGIIERRLESLGLRISNSLTFKEMKNFLRPDPLPFDMTRYQAEEPEPL